VEDAGVKRNLPLILLSYAAVYVFWGMTYFFIRMADATIPILSVMAFRWTVAGVLFALGLLLFGGLKRWPTWTEVGASLLLGLLLIVGGNGLVVVAEKKVDSYLAALIITSTPLIVAFFDLVLWRRRISAAGLFGILLGIAGMTMLLWKGGGHKFDLRPEILYLLVACVSWSLATSLGHRMKVPKNAFVNSCIQMLSTGLLMLVLMAVLPAPGPGYFQGWSAASAMGLVLLTVVGTLGFLAYNYLVQVEPAVRVVSYSFVNPVIAILLGFLLGGEKAVPLLVPGLACILVGLFLVLYFERLIEKK
jgi:drug/metabolite transporter (DMT)-like permease